MVETSLLFNTETASDIGSYIINSVINKLDPLYIKKINKKIKKITKKHVQQLASKFFKKSNMFLVINGNETISLDNINHIINDS